MQDSKKDTDVYSGLLDSEGEGEGGMIWENGIETCILSCKKQIASLRLIQYTVLIFFTCKTGRFDTKVKNITDISQKTLRIADLQGKTSYHLVLRAYTGGGMGPERSMFVVTKENCELNVVIELLSIRKGIGFLVTFVCTETPSLNFTFCYTFKVGGGQC